MHGAPTVTVSKKSDIERSHPMEMKVACVFRLRDQRGEAMETREGGFRIIFAETRGHVLSP
jgi:hypothetical protein